MIKFGDIELTFSNMGLFSTQEQWIHPTRVINSYELIFVLKGEFDMKESDKIYNLRPQTLFVLEPDLKHCGVKKTDGQVKFYWLHFYCNGFEKLGLKKIYQNAAHEKESYLFQEIMTHQQTGNGLLCDIKLAELLIKLSGTDKIARSKSASEIIEYIRINSDKFLTVSEISSHFGYSGDHCSRLVKNALGISLQALLCNTKINHIKACLLNTNSPVKEIAETCGFEDENTFVKFFKYHTGLSPTGYRNTYNGLKMNNK